MKLCLWNRHVWFLSLRLWHFDTLRYSSQNCLTGLVVVNLKLFFPNLAPKDHDAAAEDAALRAGTLDAAKPSVSPTGLYPPSGRLPLSLVAPLEVCIQRADRLSLCQWPSMVNPSASRTLIWVGWALKEWLLWGVPVGVSRWWTGFTEVAGSDIAKLIGRLWSCFLSFQLAAVGTTAWSDAVCTRGSSNTQMQQVLGGSRVCD